MTNKMIAMIALKVAKLELDEVLALSIAVRLGSNPAHVVGYKKVQSLFTEEDGTRMHEETKAVFLDMCWQRIERE